MDWMKIDQMAKRSGLTKRTIRFYEEIGLLSSPKRTEGGVRLYSEDDLEELERVISAKEVLGFSCKSCSNLWKRANTLKCIKKAIFYHWIRRKEKKSSKTSGICWTSKCG